MVDPVGAAQREPAAVFGPVVVFAQGGEVVDVGIAAVGLSGLEGCQVVQGAVFGFGGAAGGGAVLVAGPDEFGYCGGWFVAFPADIEDFSVMGSVRMRRHVWSEARILAWWGVIQPWPVR